jgi:hypothetical protein
MQAAPYGAVIPALIGVLALMGCASSGLATTSANTPTPVPTADCVYPGAEETDAPNCVMIDREQSMQQNETSKDRKTPTPTDQAILDRALAPAEAALQEIATPMPTADRVKATLTAEGLTSVEAIGDPTTGVGFWAEVQMSGCLFGEIVPETGLTIEVGGFIADGGCRALSGH